MKKRKGQISSVAAWFAFLLLFFLTAYEIQIYEYDAVRVFTEDALAASNLASAVIDLEEYGISHNIVIQNPDAAFAVYQEALKTNMKLDDSWESRSGGAISGRVEILDYIIYNVRGSDIEIYSYGQNAYTTVITGGLGNVAAPNGTLIESTSVYSRITYPVEGIMGIRTMAVKDKLADIVSDI